MGNQQETKINIFSPQGVRYPRVAGIFLKKLLSIGMINKNGYLLVGSSETIRNTPYL